MNTWLSALQALHSSATESILVTVASIQGSAPREAGARMVLTQERQFDTIGGGHLEWRAAQIARTMLADASGSLLSQRRLERIALGPSLGQCCGGVVFLAFERISVDPPTAPLLAELLRRWHSGTDVWRAVALDSPTPVMLFDANGCVIGHPGALVDLPDLTPRLTTPTSHTQVLRASDGGHWLLDRCGAYRPQVVLFGAGHVGAAIVRVLCTLPCRVIWVDERDAMFPAGLPPQVCIEATDVPNAVVDMAEPGAFFLVMTHSHALDQQLAERILKRADISWFGLIGSHTKRKQFEHRLQERGITQEQLNKMTCPIGIPGIYGKQPASIAIAVVAQLLQLWEVQSSAPQQPPQQRFGADMTTHALDGRY
jgi:xanthine dehydrogenase accessory factor